MPNGKLPLEEEEQRGGGFGFLPTAPVGGFSGQAGALEAFLGDPRRGQGSGGGGGSGDPFNRILGQFMRGSQLNPRALREAIFGLLAPGIRSAGLSQASSLGSQLSGAGLAHSGLAGRVASDIGRSTSSGLARARQQSVLGAEQFRQAERGNLTRILAILGGLKEAELGRDAAKEAALIQGLGSLFGTIPALFNIGG